MRLTLLERLAFVLLLAGLTAAPAQAQFVIPPEDIPCFVDLNQPKCREPVLIVPGLGASYNRRLMLQDRDEGTWRFAPTVDWFDVLIERLEAEGYELGQDLFVVHYDWRQTNAESAVEYLIPAIQHALDLNDPESGKVDIIAHSMGGLVARAYTQSENLYNGDVEQLILLGTPNTGAAGAYVAWEGGLFPRNWGHGAKLWIQRIEKSLKKRREQSLERPLSFRAFFPSLKELLPIEPFVDREGTVLEPAQLAEQNEFLQELEATAGRLALRGIQVTTIAGEGLSTLDTVPVAAARTAEDESLARWRDGHADPDPPLADSTAGDQTVLRASAQAVGSLHVHLDGVSHEELPGMAQNEIAQRLTGGPVGDFVPVHLASAAVGIDVMSPVMPAVFGPNGEVLSQEANTFAQADFDWDPAEPEGIKVLTIADPPPGAYRVELTGLGAGDYTVIVSYADGDETVAEEIGGAASPGAADEVAITVGEEPGSSIVIEVADAHDWLREIIRLAETAHEDGLIAWHERASLKWSALHALHDLRVYQERLEDGRGRGAEGRLKGYLHDLDKLERILDRIARRPGREEFVAAVRALLARIRAHPPA